MKRVWAFLLATMLLLGSVSAEAATCDTFYEEHENGQWTQQKPAGVPDDQLETKTQYRYADYEMLQSTSPELEGYEQIDGTWRAYSTGSTTYVKSWPAGFYQQHYLFGAYNKTPVVPAETATQKVEVSSDTVTGYIYWHWCRGTYSAGPINRTVSDVWTSTYTAFHGFYTTYAPGNLYTQDGLGYIFSNAECCRDSHWYFCLPVYTQTSTYYEKLFTYGRWGNWSDWSDTVFAATNTRKVESRTMYRYVGGGEHSWDAGVVTAEPSCAGAGIMTYTCAECGTTKMESIPAKGHKYESGYCTVCSAIDPEYGFVTSVSMLTQPKKTTYYTGDLLDMTGMTLLVTYSDGTSKMLTAGYTVSGFDSATPGNKIVMVTYEGKTTAFIVTVKAKEADAFDIPVARMILGNSLEFQFGVAKSNIPDPTGCYALIEKEWADGTMTTITVPAGQWGTAGAYWAIVYDGLAAKEMGDQFHVTVYSGEGRAISTTRTDSVSDYVSRAFDTQSEAGKTMMVDMLNYGTAAQTHFNYGVTAPANKDLTAAQKAYGTAQVAEFSNRQVKGANYLGTRFVLESRIQVQVAFAGLTEDMYAIYSYTDAEGVQRNIRVEGADFITSGTMKGVELGQLVYADARSIVAIVVYNADGTVHGLAVDGIESCAARNTKGDDLFVALMKFSDSAREYLY